MTAPKPALAPACDLCGRDPALDGSLLCKDCAEGVSRVMQIKEWERLRGRDKLFNTQQEMLLRQYLQQQQINAPQAKADGAAVTNKDVWTTES